MFVEEKQVCSMDDGGMIGLASPFIETPDPVQALKGGVEFVLSGINQHKQTSLSGAQCLNLNWRLSTGSHRSDLLC